MILGTSRTGFWSIASSKYNSKYLAVVPGTTTPYNTHVTTSRQPMRVTPLYTLVPESAIFLLFTQKILWILRVHSINIDCCCCQLSTPFFLFESACEEKSRTLLLSYCWLFVLPRNVCSTATTWRHAHDINQGVKDLRGCVCDIIAHVFVLSTFHHFSV